MRGASELLTQGRVDGRNVAERSLLVGEGASVVNVTICHRDRHVDVLDWVKSIVLQ